MVVRAREGSSRSRALTTMTDLLAELELLEREGRWGRGFALRDRLRLAIAAGEVSEGMEHRDWGLWWAMIEEMDRLEALEAVVTTAAGED